MPSLKKTVNSSGGRLTKQRKIILQYLKSVHSHPTAEMIHAKLKPRLPNLGLATVYRNLKFLVKEGLATEFSGADGREHFDGCIDPHAHCICDVCHKIHDYPISKINKPTCNENLGRVRQIEIIIRGTCRQCLDKKK